MAVRPAHVPAKQDAAGVEPLPYGIRRFPSNNKSKAKDSRATNLRFAEQVIIDLIPQTPRQRKNGILKGYIP